MLRGPKLKGTTEVVALTAAKYSDPAPVTPAWQVVKVTSQESPYSELFEPNRT